MTRLVPLDYARIRVLPAKTVRRLHAYSCTEGLRVLRWRLVKGEAEYKSAASFN